MKHFALFLLISLPLVFSACAPGQVSTAPPAPSTQTESTAPVVEAQPPEVDPSPLLRVPAPIPPPVTPVTPVTPATPAADSISEKRLEKAQEPKTLLQVIREAGVPDSNLTPGRKEQIAVYQREGKYQFYHFRESRLVASGEYPRSLIEQMKQSGSYPQEVIRDFARLPQ